MTSELEIENNKLRHIIEDLTFRMTECRNRISCPGEIADLLKLGVVNAQELVGHVTTAATGSSYLMRRLDQVIAEKEQFGKDLHDAVIKLANWRRLAYHYRALVNVKVMDLSDDEYEAEAMKLDDRYEELANNEQR